MARPTTNLPEWATDATFPASPPGMWAGQPTRLSTGLAAFAAAGHLPTRPTDANIHNAWLGLLSEWITHFRVETATVATSYSLAASQATDSVLSDALDLKGNLAGGNVWTGSQEFDGGINVDGASTVDAEMVFTVQPQLPSYDATVSGLDYSGAAQLPLQYTPFFHQDVEAGGGSGPSTVVTITQDLVESIGLLEIQFIAWNDNAATASHYHNRVVFNSPIGATPTFAQDQTITLLGGGITGVAALSLNASTPNNIMRYDLTTNANGTRNFMGWYRVLRGLRAQ